VSVVCGGGGTAHWLVRVSVGGVKRVLTTRSYEPAHYSMPYRFESLNCDKQRILSLLMVFRCLFVSAKQGKATPWETKQAGPIVRSSEKIVGGWKVGEEKDGAVQDSDVQRPLRLAGTEPASWEWKALSVVQDILVRRPFPQPADTESAGGGWEVLPVRQDTGSVQRPLQLADTESAGLGLHVLQAGSLSNTGSGLDVPSVDLRAPRSSMTGQEPPIRLDNSELRNMEMNKVDAATFLVNGGKNIAAVDVDMSGEGGSWPILLPAQTVVGGEGRSTHEDWPFWIGVWREE
jgi:hypothetical protein